jgi:phosphatidylglycerophosphatase A
MRTPASEFAARVLRHPAGWIASGAGSGFAPYASGTVGTLVALLPWLALRELPPGLYALAVAAAFGLGVWASNWVIRTIQVQDPSVVVWDEFVGVWIALFAAPAGWPWLLAGFALFRVFDILKPWPVRWADDHVEGGFGAMLDDALAGLYALLCLQVAAWFLVPGTLGARLGIA